MFCLNDTMRYHLCPGYTDMRKGINSLTGVVKEKMCANILNGDVFILSVTAETHETAPCRGWRHGHVRKTA